jgi:hypothetical protein
MSFVAAALIGGGAMIASTAIGGRGGGKVEYSQPPETEEAKKARKRLLEMAEGPLPQIPKRGIAPLPEMTEERQLARTTAKELVQPQDIFSLPEVQGIIQEANVTGNLLANRLGRALQASGNITSTTGRDVLGRAVTEVQKSLASSLAPFAMEERSRRRALIPVLEALGLTEEERKRGVSQAELDALFEKLSTETYLPYTVRKPLLESIIGLQPPVQPIIQGQQPSAISQYAPLIGPMLSAAITSKAPTTGYGFLPGQGTNLYRQTTWGGGL